MFNPSSAMICTGMGFVSVTVISAAIVVDDDDVDDDDADDTAADADADPPGGSCCNSSTNDRCAGMNGFCGGRDKHVDGTTECHRCND